MDRAPTTIADWNDLPPWRQTSFFGMHARGQFFVYRRRLLGQHDRRRSPAPRHDRAAAQRLRAAGAAEVRGDLLQQRIDPDAGRPQAPDGRPAGEEPVALVAPLDRARRRNRPPARLEAGPVAAARRRVPALRRRVSRGNRRRSRQAQHAEDPDPLRRLAGGLAGDHLKRIAAASGGQYASRPGSLQARPPSRTDCTP